jgi:hypothetical protein
MTESSESQNITIAISENTSVKKRKAGRPKKGDEPVKPVKKAIGRPKLHEEGARAFRDAKHRTLIDRKRLQELLDIEQKYILIKTILI